MSKYKVYEIYAAFDKVDHSPKATAFLQKIIDRSSPDTIHWSDYEEAKQIAANDPEAK